jgi:hypothetical protein
MYNICGEFLDKKLSFEWFIIEYFGKDKFEELTFLALRGEEENLKRELDEIWYYLPDDLFNIKENPKGWRDFLNLIEE